MFKKCLLATAFTFLMTAPVYASETKEDLPKIESCQVLKQMSNLIMTQRQQNVPISEIVNSLRENNPEHINTKEEDLVFKIIFDAYNENIAVNKKEQIEFFENKWENACILYVMDKTHNQK